MKKFIYGMLALLGLILLAAWFFSTTIAAEKAKSFLISKGVKVTSLEVSSIWFDAITLSNLALGEAGNVTADALTLIRTGDAAYPYAIEADNLRIHGRVQDALVDLGGVEKLWQAEPFPDLPPAPIAFSLTTDLDVATDAEALARGLVSVATLEVTQGVLKTILINGDFNVTTEDGPRYLVPFTVDALRFVQSDAPILAPLAVKGTLRHDQLNGATMFDASLADEAKHFTAALAGQYDGKAEAGAATLTTPTLTLGKGALELVQFLPAYAADIATPPMQLVLAANLILAEGNWRELRANATFNDAPVAAILEEALGKNAHLEGKIQGRVPMIITPRGWRIDNAQMQNQGPMKLSLLGNNAAVLVSLLGKAGGNAQALQEVNVSALNLTANTTDDKGNMLLTGQVTGHNPLINRAVQLNLNITTNLTDLLRSMSGQVAKELGVP
jgi:hypothetical protein